MLRGTRTGSVNVWEKKKNGAEVVVGWFWATTTGWTKKKKGYQKFQTSSNRYTLSAFVFLEEHIHIF